jgi:hypothetical protein
MDLAESLQVFYGDWFGGLFHWGCAFPPRGVQGSGRKFQD